jgi:hypothetical protein
MKDQRQIIPVPVAVDPRQGGEDLERIAVHKSGFVPRGSSEMEEARLSTDAMIEGMMSDDEILLESLPWMLMVG